MIRQANKFDLQDIIRLIRQFAFENKRAQAYDPLKWSKTYIEAILSDILAGKGIILIDTKENALLIAIRNPVFWVQGEYQLVECMMYAKSNLGYIRLIKEFSVIADEMKSKGIISKAIIGSFKESKFEKMGFRQIETLWER